MANIGGFQDLIAWQRAMDVVEAVYELSRDFPADERFGLTTQIRRAAVSIVSNIAEGYGRRTRADYVHFLDVARGSANEVQAQLLVAVRLKFVEPKRIEKAMGLTVEDQRILKGLVDSLEGSRKTDVRAPAQTPGSTPDA